MRALPLLVVSCHAICSASQLMVGFVELSGHGCVAPSLVVRPTGTARHGGEQAQYVKSQRGREGHQQALQRIHCGGAVLQEGEDHRG